MAIPVLFSFLRQSGCVNGNRFLQNIEDSILKTQALRFSRLDAHTQASSRILATLSYLDIGLRIIEVNKKAVQSIVDDRPLKVLLWCSLKEGGKCLASRFAHSVVAIIEALQNLCIELMYWLLCSAQHNTSCVSETVPFRRHLRSTYLPSTQVVQQKILERKANQLASLCVTVVH